ncbi:MAG TPA: DUF1003 domain-containing protein [Chitinophagaceae bacterium]|nr:DUF1003 domain-containing protein [Chitinophagaceae bacterium]
MEKRKIEYLLDTEDENLKKLNDIVYKAIEEEKLLTQKLLEFEDLHPPFSSRIADKVASFGGSWAFIITFFTLLGLWIIANLFMITRPFDPYPFILLNLILSCIAAIQAPIIMMSQNRKEQKDRQRAQNDYLINLKAEIEIRNLHSKIDLLIAEQMKNLFNIQKAQMETLEDIKANLKK